MRLMPERHSTTFSPAASMQETGHSSNIFPQVAQTATSSGPSFILRTMITLLWAACHFAFCFILQISELTAPFLLILGVGWLAVPQIISFASKGMNGTVTDAQTQETITHLNQSFPSQIIVHNHLLTPHILITYGLALVAIAAFSATICACLARRL